VVKTGTFLLWYDNLAQFPLTPSSGWIMLQAFPLYCFAEIRLFPQGVARWVSLLL
jgi:hypothetical protein